MPHLRNLKLTHSVSSENKFTIFLLIRTDHYWSFIEDDIMKPPLLRSLKWGTCCLDPCQPWCLTFCSSSNHLSDHQWTKWSRCKSFLVNWGRQNRGQHHTIRYDFPPMPPTVLCITDQRRCLCSNISLRENKPYLPSNFTTCKRRTCTLISKLRRLQNYSKSTRRLSQNKSNGDSSRTGTWHADRRALFAPPPSEEGVSYHSH